MTDLLSMIRLFVRIPLITVPVGLGSGTTVAWLEYGATTAYGTKIGLPLDVIMGSGKEEVERESYGWWIFIPRDEDLREMKHLPDDLRACIGYAKGYGCRWLCLDRDGSVTDALPEYDW